MSEFNGYSEQYAIGVAMETYGGSFMRGIGIALQNADKENTKKILTTWPEVWDKYRKFAKQMKRFGA